MSPEEKTVIGGIFERLKGAADAPRDAEADKFIADQIKVQPYAPYVMAQSIYAQEQALTGMQQKVEQLQSQVQQLEQYAQQMQQQQAQAPSGFLGSLFGGGAKAVPQPPQMNRAPFQQNQPQAGAAPAGGPWGQQPQQGGQNPGPWGQQAQPQQRAGMGFLGTAAMTAAGVAGGMLAANALTSMFTGGASGAANAATPASASPAAPASDQTASAGESNYGNNNSQEASYDDGGDFGGGGGDDWA